jgi:hypothetical protein
MRAVPSHAFWSTVVEEGVRSGVLSASSLHALRQTCPGARDAVERASVARMLVDASVRRVQRWWRRGHRDMAINMRKLPECGRNLHTVRTFTYAARLRQRLLRGAGAKAKRRLHRMGYETANFQRVVFVTARLLCGKHARRERWEQDAPRSLTQLDVRAHDQDAITNVSARTLSGERIPVRLLCSDDEEPNGGTPIEAGFLLTRPLRTDRLVYALADCTEPCILTFDTVHMGLPLVNALENRANVFVVHRRRQGSAGTPVIEVYDGGLACSYDLPM